MVTFTWLIFMNDGINDSLGSTLHMEKETSVG